jgi:hypothetical protein
MSTINDDSDAIYEKKEDIKSSIHSKKFTSNIVRFIISIITVIIVVLLYFSGSSLILFVCKLAQSNILPTQANCYPYTESKPDIQPIKTNIFPTFTDPGMSMKLEFPYDNYNSSNTILDMFREYKNQPNSNFLANYLISIIEDLISFNYSAINSMMNAVNNLPEYLVVWFGPMITGFLFAFTLLLNFPYLVCVWFLNMSWFFKTNENDENSGSPKWRDISIMSPLYWLIGIWFVILFTNIMLFGYGFVLSIPYPILCYCCLTCFMYKGVMNGKNTSPFTIIKEVLKYYKISIVGVITMFFISLAFAKLGAIPGILSIITTLVVYFGIISIDIFNPIAETKLTPLVSYYQATKKCSFTKPKEVKNGFLYNLLFGQKGGNITKELKNIGKQINK